MTKPAAFRATYSDWKLVRTRKTIQIVFEIPLEAADDALRVLGGMPDPSAERWFGIAPLRSEPETEKPEKAKKAWRDMHPSQQAAIRCGEPVFWAFLKEQHKYNPTNKEEAAEAVRELCGVASRASLNEEHRPRTIWFNLDQSFGAWKALEGVT